MQFKATQGIEIAHAISLELGKKKFSDDFSKFSDYENFKNRPFQLPNFISGLFKKGFFNSHSPAFQITPVLDDRMFVMSWFGDYYTAQRLSRKVKGQYAYENDNWWYKYLFVDVGSKSCANDTMSAELLRGATYARWADYGTLFGVSRYSFVCITPNLNSLKKNNAEFIVTHIQTIYYKMVELVLLQRACLLRFSNEITHISSMMQKDDPKLTENVSDMLKQYMRFVNKIYFREITAQEQGIELYNMLQKQMDIERHVKDLDGEIQELHNFVMLKEETRRNDRLELLSWIGGVFAVASLILSVFGMNYFGDSAIKIDPKTGNWMDTDAYLWQSVFWVIKFTLVISFVLISLVILYRFFKWLINRFR